MKSKLFAALWVFMLVCFCGPFALGDQPPVKRAEWTGSYDYVLTGATLATDTDADGNVDSLIDPALLPVSQGSLPGSAHLVRAILYWGGTQTQSGSGASSLPDSAVTLSRAGSGSHLIQAQTCLYSDGGSASYDVWICSADVTALLGSTVSQISGSWELSGYRGLVNDNASDHAAAALLLIVEDSSLPLRRLGWFDGNLTMQSSADTVLWSGSGALTGGSLAYFTLEGDPGSSSSEKVVVSVPGGQPLVLVDSLNPVGNPMNQTINTTVPVQTGTIGVDIDRFKIDSALTGVDSSVTVIFSSGSDKWWLSAFVIAADLAQHADLDADGVPDSLDNCVAVPNPSQLDFDRDLWGAACDCNDSDSTVHPGVTDVCNGTDDDCDGHVDAGCCTILVPGDLDLSGQITTTDIIRLVSFLYRSGHAPMPCLANGDVNCDGKVSPEDAVYEVTYVFKGGPAPCDICANSPIECSPSER